MKCSDCKSEETYPDTGYIVCGRCGIIISTIISDEPEWTNFDQGLDRSRCGPSVDEENPYSIQLSTFIPMGSKSFIVKDGQYISNDIAHLHIRQSYTSKQKSFTIIQNIFDNLSLKYPTCVISVCKKMWKTVVDTSKIIRSGSRKGLISNCLYYSCIDNNCPRTPAEICASLQTTSKDFNKGTKLFIEIFGPSKEWSYLFNKDSQIESYFTRYCNILERSDIIPQGKSFALSKKCTENFHLFKKRIDSVTPNSAVCGIIYYTFLEEGIPINKSILSRKLGICSPTINKVYKLIIA